jgi:hypothetical protein
MEGKLELTLSSLNGVWVGLTATKVESWHLQIVEP